MSKIFKSANVILDAERLPVDNSMPDIPYYEDEPLTEQGGGSDVNVVESAKAEAARIIEEANKRVEASMVDARLQCERLRDETRARAKEEGYAQGYNEGREEAEALKRRQLEENEAAAAEREAMIQNAEPEMVELVLEATRRIIGDICRITPGAVSCVIRAGLAEANIAGDVKIRVCPDDVDNIMALRKTLSAYVDTGTKLSIVKDPALNPMDCVIETAFGAVDCSLEQQLDALAQNVLIIMKAQDEAERES